MKAVQPEHLTAVLTACAILRAFDAETLVALGAHTGTDLQALLDAGLLRLSDKAPARYTLTSEARHTALASLREQRPRDEIELHSRAFYHYAGRLRLADADDQQPTAEDECLYHLGALHDLFVEYMEWDSIISYTSVLCNIDRYGQRIAYWIEFCEAYLATRAGDFTGGCERFERMLAHAELEPALRLRTLHACHVAYIYRSRYDKAMALLNAARPLARALGDTARRSYLLLSMSQIYNDLDDHRRALILSKLSLRLAQRSGAFYRELQARYEVGSNAMQLGLWDEALASLDEAEAAYHRLGIAQRSAAVLWAKGLIFQINGDHQRCEAMFSEALESTRQENSHNVFTAADALTQLGLLAETQGDYQRALRYYSEASAHARRYDIRHWQPILQARIASLTARLGNLDEAARLWRQAIDAVEDLRSTIDAEAIRVSLFGTTQYIYESFVLFLLDQQRPAEALAYVERARSRAFLDLLARQVGAADSNTAESPSSSEQLSGPLIPHKTVTLAEVQRQLGRDEVVLEYFTTGVRPRGDHWLNKIPEHNRALSRAVLPRPATILFIITRKHIRVKWIQDRLGTQASGPPSDLDPNKLRPSALSDDPVLDLLRLDTRIDWLSKRLLAPADRWIKHYRQIYFIPHGPLHYVPFHALRRPDGSYLLAEGGPAIAFAPSATVLLHTLREQPALPASANLAIGYNGQGHTRLEHAEREAVAVARHFAGEAWIGPAAKSAALLSQQRQLRWLHIAGHALYDHRRAHTGALLLGEGDVLHASTLLRMHEKPCRAELVTLSSCMSGFSNIVAGDELFGLQRAFLYAVAPTVICTLAKARDRVALLVMDRFYTYLQDQDGAAPARPAEALRDALIAVRTMTRDQANRTLARYDYPLLPGVGYPSDMPFARPEYWAPFMLIGKP